MISFDEFQKLDLRIGKVISVEDHPDADKLYLIKVDIGKEVQVVAGLKKYYEKDEILGKKVVLLANLEPAKLRGEVSEGMILAAEDEKGNVSLLTTDKEVEKSAKVL